jgi:hypothetical protein
MNTDAVADFTFAGLLLTLVRLPSEIITLRERILVILRESLAPGVVKPCNFTIDAPSLSGILFSAKGGEAKCLAIRNGAV